MTRTVASRRPTGAQLERRYARAQAKLAREMRVINIQFAIMGMADRMATSERRSMVASGRRDGQAQADKLDRAAIRQRRALRRLIDALARMATTGPAGPGAA